MKDVTTKIELADDDRRDNAKYSVTYKRYVFDYLDVGVRQQFSGSPDSRYFAATN